MGPFIHRQSAICLKRYCYQPSAAVRLQRAHSRWSKALRPLQALPGARGPRQPASESALGDQGLPVQEVQAEEEEVYDAFEDSDDYYTGSRAGKPSAVPEAAAVSAREPAQGTEGDTDAEDDQEAGRALTAQPESMPEVEADPPPVEEVVVDVVAATPSEYTEVEVDEEYQTFSLQDTLASGIKFLHSENLGRGISFGVAAVLGASLGLAVFRIWSKYTSTRAKRKRLVDKNKLLVEELGNYLPGNRAKLNSSVVRALKGKTEFTEVEIFRKFLWYALRERRFEQALIDDFGRLKAALQLSDEDVAAALRERAQRMYDKYGTLMLNTTGMTAEGIERKATCKALFQKILYITECEALLAADSPAAGSVNLREIFGATEEDLQEARIVSLYDVDLESLDALASAATDDAATQLDGGEKNKEEQPAAAIPAPSPAPEAAPPAPSPAPEAAPPAPSPAPPPPPPSQPVLGFQDVEPHALSPAPPGSASQQPAAPPGSQAGPGGAVDAGAGSPASKSDSSETPPPGNSAGSDNKSS